ncbi:MAG: CDP-diacylglycerol--serine O-phosphatidyltransferase [Acidobacteriota bacterium]
MRIPKRFRRRLPELKRRRAAYALPTLFTAGNLFLGFLAILKSFQGAMLGVTGDLGANPHFEVAAKAIGVAVVLDGLDGRIARMTHTVSDFGRELDSLADIITFGLAPAILAFAWGVQFAGVSGVPFPGDHLHRIGYFVTFVYVLCGAARLARFNIQANPVPRNPGRADRKYFVGLPVPGAAALIAAVVFAADCSPLAYWPPTLAWMLLLALLSFLMVSTWRYRSFKDFQLLRPRSPLTVVLWGSLIYMLWYYSQPVLLGMAVVYVGSGIVVRAGGALRRRFRHAPAHPEHQVG